MIPKKKIKRAKTSSKTIGKKVKPKESTYIFTIGAQSTKGKQSELKEGMIQILEACDIEFHMDLDKETSRDFLSVKKTEFKFNKLNEAVEFAIRVLETKNIFFCSLKKQ